MSEISYKKTGIDWMPEVPAHWQIRKLKTFSSLKARIGFHGLSSTDFIDSGPYCITGTDFANGRIDFANCYHVSKYWHELDPNIQIKNGDILLTKDGTIGKVAVVEGLDGKATLNSGVFVLRTEESVLIPRLLFWQLSSRLFTRQIDGLKKGTTINHLYERDFNQFRFLIPSLPEQKIIADYIDRQSAKIAYFVERKERFIELLKEQRQSIITHAVTKGIDPNAKLKPSGIDWLGDVPEHWELRRLKNVCVLQRGHDLPKEQFVEGSYPVYGSNGIIGYHNEFTTRAPCITVGRSGSVGELNFIERDFWAHNTALYVKEHFGNSWDYLYYLLSSIDIKLVSNGSAVPTLDRNNVHALKVAFAPVEEQKQIVDYIRSETRLLDNAISKAEREIELMKEYREAMIAEAITGKLPISKEEICQ